jgi:adenosine/AMP kinase
MALGAGHTFIIFIDGGFPVNVLNAVKAVPGAAACIVARGSWLCVRRAPGQHDGAIAACACCVHTAEVCRIHCATANPTSVILACTSDEAKVTRRGHGAWPGQCHHCCCCSHGGAHGMRARTRSVCPRTRCLLLHMPRHTLPQGIMGVIDGVVPTDFETEDDKKKR